MCWLSARSFFSMITLKRMRHTTLTTLTTFLMVVVFFGTLMGAAKKQTEHFTSPPSEAIKRVQLCQLACKGDTACTTNCLEYTKSAPFCTASGSYEVDAQGVRWGNQNGVKCLIDA